MEQVPNIEEFGNIYEPIDSPEYNKYLKENEGYITYCTEDGKFNKSILPEGNSITTIYHPDFDGKRNVPYRISFANGTYKDPRISRQEWWEKAAKEGRVRAIILDRTIYE